MAGYFLDTSAIVKRYVQEIGTSWVRGLTGQGNGDEIYLARITLVELTSAIARRRRGGTLAESRASSILSRFRRQIAGRYLVVGIPPGFWLTPRTSQIPMSCEPMTPFSSPLP